ncbi:GIY-YIG nuclease family protein [candidate division KSB1 bacterium]|nr:GIY-YIG nuclease family protein [candidate division KSB1 bacterium]
MSGYVYILQSKKNFRYYIGSTKDIKRRLEEHHQGKSKATRNIRPLELVYCKHYSILKEARQQERRLKSFKRRKIIERIIEKSKE